MKKFLSYLLVAIMCLSSLAACGENKPAGNEALEGAIGYVHQLYKNAAEVTGKDFTRTAQVMVDGVKYPVEWTTNNEAIKVTVNGTEATIDVPEDAKEDISYTLTATVKDEKGNKLSKEYKHIVPKNEGQLGVLKQAYALEAGATMEGTFTLTGVISEIDSEWSDQYKNISVVIICDNQTEYPMLCYRLADGTATGCSTLAVGDTITVTGSITNYKGTIEYAQGCTLEKLVKGEGSGNTDKPATPEDVKVDAGLTGAQIVDLAYKLVENQKFASEVSLTGKVTEIQTPYDANYKNVSVVIQVEGASNTMLCFRMKGEGAENVKVDDVITVTGIIKNYKGTIEFDAGCTFVAGTVDAGATDKPADKPADTTDYSKLSAAEIVKLAYELEEGKSFDKAVTLTGVITKVKYSYSDEYGNGQCTITVEGKDILCYKIAGDNAKLLQFEDKAGATDITVGDTITVTGVIKNYNGTIEFDGCTLDSYELAK